ncbi:MAG: SulP family inorganic anion transporter [Verrucomicrobiales bacterium]|jgi:SulP family sulfate permease|nr:SulP family inorganic anion transporter [Verrucomicrobiales bacterium]
MKRRLFFRPKLMDVLAEGYSRAQLRTDVFSGIMVGLMAIPLAIGFGIASVPNGTASPVSPATIGLTTAILAGFIISAFGGSRVQIGGPTGAFIPIVAGIVYAHGMTCLWMATLMAGVLLIVMGALKAGAFSRYIPLPVVVGFTSGIAVIIGIQQIQPMLGLNISGGLPPETLEKIKALAANIHHLSPLTAVFSVACLAGIFLVPDRWRPRVTVLVAATLVANLSGWTQTPADSGLATIGSTFGKISGGAFIDAIPSGLPRLVKWDISWELVREAIPSAMIIAFLGAVESILSAMATDKMIKDRHNSDQELVAQGLANCVVPWFGGLPATGAIARSSTNVQSGGRTPVSGIVHAVCLLVVMLVASEWVAYIPMCVLAAILLHVAFKMFEGHHFNALRKVTHSELLIAVVTFLLTVCVDLNVGVGFGLAVAAVTLILRLKEITIMRPISAGSSLAAERPDDAPLTMAPEILQFRFEGILFYAVSDDFTSQLERAIKQRPRTRVVILRVERMLALDFEGLVLLEDTYNTLRAQGIHLVLCNAQPHPTRMMFKHGFLKKLGLENLCGDMDNALQRAQTILAATH